MLVKIWKNWNHVHAGGNVKWCKCHGKLQRVIRKNLKIPPYDLTFGYIFRTEQSLRHICTQEYSSTICNSQDTEVT